MSKTSVANKKAKAEGKLKGKKALTAASRKAKQEAPKEKLKPKTINGDRCCHCTSYAKWPEGGHYCKRTGKPTPRKATCDDQNPTDN